MIQLFRTTRRAALDLVYPPSCASCDCELPPERRGDDPSLLICDDCFLEMPIFADPVCPRCGTQGVRVLADGCVVCRDARFRFDETIALGMYSGNLRQLLLRMKRGGSEATTLAVGRLMWSQCREQLVAAAADVVVPVPMYWSRRLVRGTNSAAVLADDLAGRLGLPLADRVLYRRRNTLLQSELPPSARDRNLHDALAVRAGYAFQDARVLLVDDIMTTGSTANAAARALKASGAGHVALAVVARTQVDSDPETLLAPIGGTARMSVSPQA
jgi:ComF family protein